MRNKTKALVLLGITILLSSQVSAVRMGLIAIFADGTIYQKCLDVENGASGYDILEQSGLSITWSPSIRYGHQLCAINGLGCPADNCHCNQKGDYWNFFLKRIGYSDWEYPDSIESRFDAGSTCQEHYCAKEGDIIGLKYSFYQNTPFPYRFGDICPIDTTNDLHVKRNTAPLAVGQVVSADPQKTFSFFILAGFFFVAVLLGTVRYVKKRK
jgi:hypothetical protein